MKGYIPKVVVIIASGLLCGWLAFGQLQITNFEMSETGTVNLSWTFVTTNYIVQQRDSLLTGTWQYVDKVVATNLNTVSNASDSCFYRIRQVRALNFADTNFEQAVRSAITNKFPPTNEVYDIDVNTMENLNVASKSITNMAGIEEFIALTNLICGFNQITNLDISANTNLIGLYCYNNQLSNLDVSANVKLEVLYSDFNPLTNLDVSLNTNLICLGCFSNKLTSIDVSSNTNLQYLNLERNSLTNIDVSRNKRLKDFYCSDNQLTNINISANTELSSLSFDNNQLTNLDVTANTNLTWLYCNFNKLTNSLNLYYNEKISVVYVMDNFLTEIILFNTNMLPSTFQYDAGVTIRQGP